MRKTLTESVDQWGVPSIAPLEEAAKQKSPKVPRAILGYIRGEDSAPETNDPEIQKYKKAIYPILKEKFPSGFLTVYRAFTWGSEIDWDGNVNPEDMALSYSDSKSFALGLAKERREDYPDEWVYAIEVKLPIDQIYFHHSLDAVGAEHPKEREVIAMAAGAETKIIKEYPPLESLDEGARGDWEKEAFTMNKHDFSKRTSRHGKYVIKNNQPDENGVFEVNAYLGKRIVGTAVLLHHGAFLRPVSNQEARRFGLVTGTDVAREHQRMGLATAMYVHAEKVTGLKMQPAEDQTPDAKALWSQPNRPFGIKEDQEPDLASEYEGILKQLYPKAFVQALLDSDEAASEFLGGEIEHEKSGDLLIRFVDGPKRVGIMGLLSKTGRLRPSDASALRQWLRKLGDALDSGKEVFVSLNDKSEPLFWRAFRGKHFEVETISEHEFPFGSWKTLRVTPAEAEPAPVLESVDSWGIPVLQQNQLSNEFLMHQVREDAIKGSSWITESSYLRGHLKSQSDAYETRSQAETRSSPNSGRIIIEGLLPPFKRILICSQKDPIKAVQRHWSHPSNQQQVEVEDFIQWLNQPKPYAIEQRKPWTQNTGRVRVRIGDHVLRMMFNAAVYSDVLFLYEFIVFSDHDYPSADKLLDLESVTEALEWRDLVRGEWWLDPSSGQADFADIDVGEAGHEAIAIANLLSEFSSEFQEYFGEHSEELGEHLKKFLQYDDLDDLRAAYVLGEIEPEIGEQIMGEVWREMNQDARRAYMKRTGAIMVIDSNFAAWKIEAKDLKAMQEFLWDQLSGEEGALSDGQVGVEEMSTGKWIEMPAQDFLDLKGPRELWRLKEDEELFTDPSGQYWGNAGAGGIFYAEDTGRFLIAKRSAEVNEPNTWGTWGGKLDSGETPEQALKREIREETGYRGKYRLKLLSTYEDGEFRFDNYLIIVPQEFEPEHSWETSDHAWVEMGEWPKPLHFGLEALIPHLEEGLRVT